MSDLVNFAETISEIPLKKFQKHFLDRFESERNNGEELIVNFPRMCGRKMMLDIIKQFEKYEQNVK